MRKMAYATGTTGECLSFARSLARSDRLFQVRLSICTGVERHGVHDVFLLPSFVFFYTPFPCCFPPRPYSFVLNHSGVRVRTSPTSFASASCSARRLFPPSRRYLLPSPLFLSDGGLLRLVSLFAASPASLQALGCSLPASDDTSHPRFARRPASSELWRWRSFPPSLTLDNVSCTCAAASRTHAVQEKIWRGKRETWDSFRGAGSFLEGPSIRLCPRSQSEERNQSKEFQQCFLLVKATSRKRQRQGSPEVMTSPFSWTARRLGSPSLPNRKNRIHVFVSLSLTAPKTQLTPPGSTTSASSPTQATRGN